MSPTIRIDHTSTTPPYEQLRRQLEMQIRAGALKPGDRLPTVRQLALDLGIAKNTVGRAFRELEEAGLASGLRRNGTVVLERADQAGERERIIHTAVRKLIDDIHAIDPTIDEIIEALRQHPRSRRHAG